MYGDYLYNNNNNNNSIGYGMQQYNNMQSQTMQRSPQANYLFSFVNGIEGAKAFLVPAGATAILRDSDAPGIFFTKVANMQGQASLRKFKYEEISIDGQPKTQTFNPKNFVSRKEFEELKKLIKAGNKNV